LPGFFFEEHPMFWFPVIIDLALAAAVAFFIIRGVMLYRAAQGTVWQRLLAAGEGSATILWQYLVIAAGALLDWSVRAADALNQPDVANFIQTNISATTAAKIIAVIGFITILARLRSLWRTAKG
jgi:hypothetical protein